MAAIIVFLIFFLPLVVIPITSSPFEAPKVILAEILIEVMLFIFILRSASRRREVTFKIEYFLLKSITGKWWPFLGLFTLSLIHLILLRTPISFFGNAFRLQGVFLLWHLLVFSIISGNIKLDQIPKFVYPLSLLGLFLGTFVLGGNEAQRAVGTLGEPNALAATAIFIWPFAFLSFWGSASWRRLQKLLPITAPTIALVIIFLSGSRSGLLAFVIQLFFLLFTKMTNLTIAKSVILCLILIAFNLILPLIEGGGWFENRSEVYLWQLKLNLLKIQ